MSSNAPIKRSQLLYYGAFAMPVAFAGMPLYVHAPDFYATQYGISLSVLGLILLGLRFFDAVQDPLIGKMGDRFSYRVLPVMIISALILVGGMYALFHPLVNQPELSFAVAMLFAVSAYSILSINLNTLGALWSKDEHQKTRITMFRETFGLLGLLLAVSLPSILKQHMPAAEAFEWMVWILAALFLVTLFLLAVWLAKHPYVKTRTQATKMPAMTLFKRLPAVTKRFFVIYAISMLASSIPAVLVLFFIRDRLDSEDMAGLFLLLYFLSGAATMWVWQRASIMLGKNQAWMISMILASCCFVWAFFLGVGDVWQFAVICILSGMALGADLALPPSILADHVQAHGLSDYAATQFSILTFLSKAALAIGSAITLLLLDMVGFVPASANEPHALWALSAAYALIPCFIKLTAAALLYRVIKQTSKEGSHEKFSQNSISGSSNHA